MCLCWQRAGSWPRVRRRRCRRMHASSRPISAAALRRVSLTEARMSSEPLLSVTGLHAGYGATEILHGIDLKVGVGEIVAVLGSNGAGKSTLNRALSGVVRASRGSIRFDNVEVERDRPAAIVSRGLIHVPEGRCIFPNMTVRENLDLGCYRRARARRHQNRERAFAIFPRLYERQ